MNLMGHARLLVLLHCSQAPSWFIKAFRHAVMRDRYGTATSEAAAQELWAEITQGTDPGDQALADAVTVRGETRDITEFVAGHSAR